MDTFVFTISQENKTLNTTPRMLTIGRRNDHMAQQLQFVRPSGRDDDNLILYFRGNNQVEVFSIDIGTENSYPLTNELTKWSSLNMQTAFLHDGEETKHSSVVTLKFGVSLGNNDATPITTSSVSELFALECDDEGNLYAVYGNGAALQFEYDDEGNLYVEYSSGATPEFEVDDDNIYQLIG